jgi:hypothetical protein
MNDPNRGNEAKILKKNFKKKKKEHEAFAVIVWQRNHPKYHGLPT